MSIKNRIWDELFWAKVCILCIQRYTSWHRRYNRWYETFIALTASFGAFGFLYDHLAPLFSTLVIGFVSVAKAIFPSLIQKEEELSSLDVISDFYVAYMMNLELLYYNYQNKLFDKDADINDHLAAEHFFMLKESECEKQSRMNKLLRKISDKNHARFNKDATDYVNRVYFNKYENESNN